MAGFEHQIQGLAVRGDDRELEVEGGAESLRLLAEALSRPAVIEASDDGASAVIRVQPRPGKVALRWEAGAIVISGDEESLAALARTLDFTANGPEQPSPVPYHSHVEFYDGHLWLDRSSTPLIVTLR